MFVSDGAGGKSGGLNYNISMSVRWGSGESLIITWWEENNVFISFNSGHWTATVVYSYSVVQWCTVTASTERDPQWLTGVWAGHIMTPHWPHWRYPQPRSSQESAILEFSQSQHVSSVRELERRDHNNVPWLARPLLLSSGQLHSFVFWSRLVELHNIKTSSPPLHCKH